MGGDINGLVQQLSDDVARLRGERDEARASDAESMAMYRRCRDRADEARALLAECRDELRFVREEYHYGSPLLARLDAALGREGQP